MIEGSSGLPAIRARSGLVALGSRQASSPQDKCPSYSVYVAVAGLQPMGRVENWKDHLTFLEYFFLQIQELILYCRRTRARLTCMAIEDTEFINAKKKKIRSSCI
jgi:hypothetical protein